MLKEIHKKLQEEEADELAKEKETCKDDSTRMFQAVKMLSKEEKKRSWSVEAMDYHQMRKNR